MKTIITIIILFFTTISISFGQDTNNTTRSFESVLLPYVEKTLKGLEKGVEYASEEIPIVLEQYILYTAVTSWLYVLLGIIVFIVGIKLGLHFWKKDWDGEEKPAAIFTMIIGVIGGIALFFTSIAIAIKSTFFPKLFLVEKFIQLM